MFKVKEVGDQGTKGYGKFIRLIRPDGSESVYGHLSEVFVKAGDEIHSDTMIAKSGNTGFSTGPHLHWGYRPPGFNSKNGYAGYTDQKPLIVLPPVAGRVSQWFGSNPSLYKPFGLAGHNGIDYAVPVGTLVYPGQLTTDNKGESFDWKWAQKNALLYTITGETDNTALIAKLDAAMIAGGQAGVDELMTPYLKNRALQVVKDALGLNK